MKGVAKAGIVRRTHTTAALAAVLSFCLASPFAFAAGQHSNAPRPALGSRGGNFHPQPNRSQMRPQVQSQPRVFGNPVQSAPQYRNNFAPQNAPGAVHPAMPGSVYPGQAYGRPAYPGVGGAYAPPGHLGAWLNAHRGVPAQDQERMLRNDPSFSRLPQGQQQRLMQQFNRVDQMPEAQRERRLARAENLERLSPQQRTQVQDSARRWTTLPADRQTAMKSAFRDLRNVPPDQRSTVLNSARYQNAFSPEERGILSNMLTVEPYQPPR
jgi:hypothetical protein